MRRQARPRDYRSHHSGADGRAHGYDDRLFRAGKYEWEVWQWERPLLDLVVERYVPRRARLLDFACGTGRIIDHIGDRFEEATGLDLSPEMIAQARAKTPRSRFVQGDVTRDPDLAPGPFDLITAFRFFLNAEPDLQDAVLRALVPRLRDETSVLFFNVHGNRFSTRQPVARFKSLQGKDVHWMSRRQVRRLVEAHGLEIVEWFGLSHWGKAVYKHVPRFVWRGLEGMARLLRFPRHTAVNLYFVCRKRP